MSELSVVVPALDEEVEIEGTLRRAREALGPRAELIVVDGGSRDRTVERARGHARVLRSPKGRGRQLNAGAATARSPVLLFLHADTHLPRGSGEAILRALEAPGVVGGWFRFGVRPRPRSGGGFWWLERAVNVRTRLFRSATGDQGIFVHRDTFREMGGFREIPLFEDVAFSGALRRRGRVVLLPLVARTSRRRWERRGLGRTAAEHLALRAAYRLGVGPERLALLYESGRVVGRERGTP